MKARKKKLLKPRNKLFYFNKEKDYQDNNLYVITTIFNPQQFKSRHKLYKEFEKRTLRAGAVLIVIEAVFGNNKPEVVEIVSRRQIIIRVKADCQIWLKENLINIALKYLYILFPKWRYVSWIDADLGFVRPDWKDETIRLLKTHPIIQMFSHLTQLNSKHEPLRGFGLSFMEGWNQNLAFKNKTVNGEDPTKIRYGWCGAPGGAWAATRDCIDKIYPLLDIGILGSGDLHMATALMGYIDLTFTMQYTAEYQDYLLAWQEKAKVLKGNVGYMQGLLVHYWHGKLADRGYDTRWKLLVKHRFNPYTDLITNSSGVYTIIPEKADLIKDLELYFESRKEDLE